MRSYERELKTTKSTESVCSGSRPTDAKQSSGFKYFREKKIIKCGLWMSARLILSFFGDARDECHYLDGIQWIQGLDKVVLKIALKTAKNRVSFAKQTTSSTVFNDCRAPFCSKTLWFKGKQSEWIIK